MSKESALFDHIVDQISARVLRNMGIPETQTSKSTQVKSKSKDKPKESSDAEFAAAWRRCDEDKRVTREGKRVRQRAHLWNKLTDATKLIVHTIPLRREEIPVDLCKWHGGDRA